MAKYNKATCHSSPGSHHIIAYIKGEDGYLYDMDSGGEGPVRKNVKLEGDVDMFHPSVLNCLKEDMMLWYGEPTYPCMLWGLVQYPKPTDTSYVPGAGSGHLSTSSSTASSSESSLTASSSESSSTASSSESSYSSPYSGYFGQAYQYPPSNSFYGQASRYPYAYPGTYGQGFPYQFL